MLPHAPRSSAVLRHAFLFLVILLSLDVEAKKLRSKQLQIICKEPRSHGCIKWVTTKYMNEVVFGDILTENSEYNKWCGLSDLRPIRPHKKYIKVTPFQENKAIGIIYCKLSAIKNGTNFSLISIKRELATLKRNTRQAVFPPRGRYRGQTQSQYLSIDHGNGKGEGKAEAHSAADSSSASVSGNSGMGQAQSQSIYDPNCEECLGRPNQDSQYLKKPTSAVGGNAGSHPGTFPGQNGIIGSGNYPGQSNQMGRPGIPDFTSPNGHPINSLGSGVSYPGGPIGASGTSYPGQTTTLDGGSYHGQIGPTAPVSYPSQGNQPVHDGGYPSNIGTTGIDGRYPVQNGTPGTSGSYPGQNGASGNGVNYPGQIGKTGAGNSYIGQGGSKETGGQYPGQGGTTGTVGSFPAQNARPGSGSSYSGQGGTLGTGPIGSRGNGGSYPGQVGSTGTGGSYPAQGSTLGTGVNYPGQIGSTGNGGSYPGQDGTTLTGGSYPGQGGTLGTSVNFPGQIGSTGESGSYPGQGGITGTSGIYPGQTANNGNYLGQGAIIGTGRSYPGQGSDMGIGGSYPGHGGTTGTGGIYRGQGDATGPSGGRYPNQNASPDQSGIYPQHGGSVSGYPGQFEGTRPVQSGGNYNSQGTGLGAYPNLGQKIDVGNLSNKPNQGNGVMANGQGLSNTWPFLTGKFPDGTYYCCVVAPNGKPQGFGPGVGLQTNGHGGSSIPPNNVIGPVGPGNLGPGSSTSPTGFNQGLNPNQGPVAGVGQNEAGQYYPGLIGPGFNPTQETISYPNQGNTGGNFPGNNGVSRVENGFYPIQGGTGVTYPSQTGVIGTGGTYPGQTGIRETGSGSYPKQGGITGTYPGQTVIGGRGSGSYPNQGGMAGPNPNQTGNVGTGSVYYPNQSGTAGTYPGQTGSSGVGSGSSPNQGGSVGTYSGQTGNGGRGGGSYPNQSGSAGLYPGQTENGGAESGSYLNPGGATGTYPGQTGNGGAGSGSYPKQEGTAGTYPGQTVISGTGSGTYPLEGGKAGSNRISGTGSIYPGQTDVSGPASGSYPNQVGTGGTGGQSSIGGTGGIYPNRGATSGTYPSQPGTANVGQIYPGTHDPSLTGGQGPNQVTSFPNQGMDSAVQTGAKTPAGFGPTYGGQFGTPTGLGPGFNQQGIGGQNGYNTPGGTGTIGYDNQKISGGGTQFNGAPQNVLDPSYVASIDDDSEALASVAQADNGTTANASSKGGNAKGRAQTNVQGTYSGSGSFSAQAQISDENKAAESEVTGGKKGASSKAQGSGRSNKSQASVQLGSETGSIQTNSQSDGNSHFSNSQVQGSLKGGMADSQARGPGITSSQAQIGFTPYKKGDKSHELFKNPFVGSGTASAQSSGRVGQSQSQLHGTFKYGITYNGAAQAGASLDKDTVLPNRIAFNKIDVFNEKEKNINVNIPNEEKASNATDSDRLPNIEEISIENSEVLKNSETKKSNHIHADHHVTEDTPSQTPAPVGGKRSFQHNNGDYEYKTEKEDNDDYDPTIPDNTDIEQGEYYDDLDATHQPLQNGNPKKSLDIKQNTGGNSQHIVLDSLKNQDAFITQRSSQRHDESRVYQPGERVPGTGGYTIPIGFTGSVKSVASKDNTYVIGSNDSPSQAQSVSLKPGAGKVRFSYPSSYPKNVPSKDLRSLHDSKSDTNRYLSVSKSVTRDLDNRNNIQKQYSHTYYTKASSCGFFTFTCTIVSGPDGRKKICKPKIPTKPDGTPMKC